VKALDGSQPVIVTSTSAQESYPAWSPDGNSLVFFAQDAVRTIYVVRREGGKWGVPVRIGVGATPRWMPDGRIVHLGIGRADAAREPPGLNLVIVNADGRDPRIVYSWTAAETRPSRVVPSVDGQTIYVKTADALVGGRIWAVSANGGALRPLLRFDDPLRPSTRTDFAVDATRLFFRIENRQSDIWVTELTKH
jgi:Tol biopolymer transport system component